MGHSTNSQTDTANPGVSGIGSQASPVGVSPRVFQGGALPRPLDSSLSYLTMVRPFHFAHTFRGLLLGEAIPDRVGEIPVQPPASGARPHLLASFGLNLPGDPGDCNPVGSVLNVRKQVWIRHAIAEASRGKAMVREVS